MRFGPPPSRSNRTLIPTSYGSSKSIMRMSPRQHRSNKPPRTVSIIGTGSYVPERILTNQDLKNMVDETDQWIRTRTGIRERRIAMEHETPSVMATRAALSAMEQAEVAP